MKPAPFVLAAVGLTVAPSALAWNDARVLLAVGDVLEGGRTVVRIHDLDLGHGSRWAARVDLRRHDGTFQQAALVDGRIVMAAGDVASSGETVIGIGSVRIAGAGSHLVKTFLDAPGTPFSTATALEFDGAEILREGRSFVPPGFPPTATLERIHAAEIAGPFVLCTARVALEPGASAEAAVMLRVEGGSVASVRVLSTGGTLAGGLSWPIEEFLPSAALASDGSFVTTVALHGPSDGATAGLTKLASAFEAGTPGPKGSGTWSCVAPHVACALGGRFAVGGTILDDLGDSLGVVAFDGSLVAQEGERLSVLPYETVADFTTAAVALSEVADLAFAIPLASGDHVVVVDDDVLLRSGDRTRDGRRVARIAYDRIDALDLSDAGHLVAALVELGDGAPAIALVEREAGESGQCATARNSTGKRGRLRAIGSSHVAYNELRLDADALPFDSFGIFLASRTHSSVPSPGGSLGTLCLGGAIAVLGPAFHTGEAGRASRVVDLLRVPTVGGPVAAAAGETWGFQAWHRDLDPASGPTSNFTEAAVVSLR